MQDSLYQPLLRTKLSTSRRFSLYNQWQPLLVADGLSAIGLYLERARAHDQETQALEVRWRTRESVGVYGAETVALDNVVDHVVGGIHDMAVAQLRGFPAGSVEAVAAERLLADAFPLGLKAVVNAPFVDEAAEVERIIALCESSLAAEVASLHLTDLLARLRTVAREYREAVDAGNQRLVFAQVQAAQERGMSYVAELLVRILAVYHDSDEPASVSARNRYLACLYEQQERERKLRNLRRNGESEDQDHVDEEEPAADPVDEAPADDPDEEAPADGEASADESSGRADQLPGAQ